jgi:hypothetical protein
MDQEVDDNYVVEHGDNFNLNKEQLRKLIEAKFNRNRRYVKHIEQRESEHESVD